MVEHFERLDGLWQLVKPKLLTLPRLCRCCAYRAPLDSLIRRRNEWTVSRAGKSDGGGERRFSMYSERKRMYREKWMDCVGGDGLIVLVRRFVFGRQGSPSAAQRPPPALKMD